MERVKVSVLTPTYNRRDLLGRLFKSMCNQSDQDFQWIIIDDGSTDGTENYIQNLLLFSSLKNVVYLKKENGGKHRALNYAHKYIKGDLVTVVDSDDFLMPDAIAIIKKYWEEYKKQKPALMIFQRGKMTGRHEQFDQNFIDKNRVASMTDFINEGMSGDHCEVASTEFFLKYKFPEYPGEKFMGEAWLWHKIGENGIAVFINEVIYLCDYLPGGLTKSGRKMRLNNPKGGMEHARYFLKKRYRMSIRFKNALLYVCYGSLCKERLAGMIKQSGNGIIVLFAYIPGMLLKKYWIMRNK